MGYEAITLGKFFSGVEINDGEPPSNDQMREHLGKTNEVGV
jgi:hypothetical protein